MHRAERKGGVGGGGKLMRADGKGKKGQEKRKERENQEKFFSNLPYPRISAMKDKNGVSRKINGNHIQIIVETCT